jgi:diphosphomevalonate decarboxylase
MQPFTALAHPNIAFIKYWGNKNEGLRLPSNGSISMNLDGLETRTTVQFEDSLPADEITIDGKITRGEKLLRVSKFLDEVRKLAEIRLFARVKSENNFPTGAGIASSASAFAALALAATRAAGFEISPEGMGTARHESTFDQAALSSLARRGSGSACRSIPGGFVEWAAGTNDMDSFATSIAPPGHWHLVDCIALISTNQKSIGSSEGHALAGTSLIQASRVDDAPRRLDICRRAILERSFTSLAEIIEEDSNLMHAVMMTSHPPLFYWQPATLAVMQAVREARAQGLQVCSTIDAGPNVHVICTAAAADETSRLLAGIPGVLEIRPAGVGGAARLVDNPSAN